MPRAKKLLLISPRATFFGRNPKHQQFKRESREFQFFDYTWTGFATGLIIVGSLTPPEYDVRYVDENIEPVDFDAEADLVAVTGMTAQADRMYEIAAAFRARGVPVVAGGLHANLLPKEVARHVDAVCVGEAEALWPQVLHDFEQGELKPMYRQRGRADLTQAPRPRWELAQQRYYPSVWVETSRGCPHTCRFCAATIRYRDKLGLKSVDQVIAEVELVRERFDNPYVLFSDDNFVVDRGRTRELLKRLIPLGIKWSGQSDVSFYKDPEILELMHDSGCMMMLIGFESVSTETLTGIDERNWKLRALSTYVDATKAIQDHGIGVYGAFTLGLDTDTKDSFEETAAFMKDNYLAGIQASCVTLFPGTPLRGDMEREGRILTDRPWSHYTVFDAVYQPKHMTPEELEEGTIGIYRSFYNREFSLRKTRHFKSIYRNLVRKKAERDEALATTGRSMV
ncbi:B12-binding domain-containing radical SAM protein [Streptomyces adelaidensis]|uniref:B12-binding domain-containing radical SAM protein n=1 Tax=Streptomyces adelaidensis TaxID=2796465 RepID=UPI001908A42B|nr:radical SAM protein [Streptomyces adelaidensis]